VTPGPTGKVTPGPTGKVTPGPTGKVTPGPTGKVTPGPANNTIPEEGNNTNPEVENNTSLVETPVKGSRTTAKNSVSKYLLRLTSPKSLTNADKTAIKKNLGKVNGIVQEGGRKLSKWMQKSRKIRKMYGGAPPVITDVTVPTAPINAQLTKLAKDPVLIKDKVKVLGAPSPVTPAPTTKAPGTKAPGTKAPGTKAPGTKLPGTKLPGTKLPVTKEFLDSTLASIAGAKGDNIENAFDWKSFATSTTPVKVDPDLLEINGTPIGSIIQREYRLANGKKYNYGEIAVGSEDGSVMLYRIPPSVNIDAAVKVITQQQAMEDITNGPVGLTKTSDNLEDAITTLERELHDWKRDINSYKQALEDGIDDADQEKQVRALVKILEDGINPREKELKQLTLMKTNIDIRLQTLT